MIFHYTHLCRRCTLNPKPLTSLWSSSSLELESVTSPDKNFFLFYRVVVVVGGVGDVVVVAESVVAVDLVIKHSNPSYL